MSPAALIVTEAAGMPFTVRSVGCTLAELTAPLSWTTKSAGAVVTICPAAGVLATTAYAKVNLAKTTCWPEALFPVQTA